MRLLSYFLKTFRENFREWKISILVLVFGPFFVYMMYAYFGSATPSYNLLVLNRDQQVVPSGGGVLGAGEELIRQWSEAKYPEGKRIFTIRSIQDLEAGRKLLKDRDADLLIVIPPDFSRSVNAAAQKSGTAISPVKNVGDGSNVRFMVASALADYITYTTTADLAKFELPTIVEFEGLGTVKTQNEFDLYVPALLVLAIIMVLFTAAASIIKEVDKGTITRLVLSKLSAFDFLAAISLNQVLIGTVALALTYAAAYSVGYRSLGSIPLFLLTGALTILGVIAISLIVAGGLRTIFELMTVGVFPFFILMFFSECMFPLPRLTLAKLAGHVYYVNDLLPTSLAVKAFNKILNFDAGLKDIGFELVGILILTAIYFGLGLWFFYRRHLRPR